MCILIIDQNYFWFGLELDQVNFFIVFNLVKQNKEINNTNYGSFS